MKLNRLRRSECRRRNQVAGVQFDDEVEPSARPQAKAPLRRHIIHACAVGEWFRRRHDLKGLQRDPAGGQQLKQDCLLDGNLIGVNAILKRAAAALAGVRAARSHRRSAEDATGDLLAHPFGRGQ